MEAKKPMVQSQIESSAFEGASSELTGNDFAHLHHLLCKNLIQLEKMFALLPFGADLTRRQRGVL